MTKKIALLCSADPNIFPPTINAANILDENGYDVTIYGIKQDTGENIKINKNVDIIYSSTIKNKKWHIFHILYQIFFILFKGLSTRYHWVISYDTIGALSGFILAISSNAKWYYHNHDLALYNEYRGIYKIFKIAEMNLVKNFARLIVFPQIDRAKIFKNELHLPKAPLIVNNSPRKKWLKKSKAHNSLSMLRNQHDKIILYQGTLFYGCGLDIFFEILEKCKTNVGMCIIGKELHEGVRKTLNAKLVDLNIIDKVVFLDVISYDDLNQITGHCDLGIARLSQSRNDQLSDYYNAGASNKIFEYMAHGMPAIFSDTEPNRNFIELTSAGIIIDLNDFVLSAAEIDKILADSKRYKKMSRKIKKLFLNEYNYDCQFQKVIDEFNLST